MVVLGNLGTLPSSRGKGAGTALTSWPFEKADREGVAVYLDTDEQGSAKRIYDRLGFKKVGEVSMAERKEATSIRHVRVFALWLTTLSYQGGLRPLEVWRKGHSYAHWYDSGAADEDLRPVERSADVKL